MIWQLTKKILLQKKKTIGDLKPTGFTLKMINAAVSSCFLQLEFVDRSVYRQQKVN
jgi:hypothetical protein